MTKRSVQRLRAATQVAGIAALALLVGDCAGRRPPPTAPHAPAGMAFVATAYCHGTKTATGTRVRRGIVAADPSVLPLGSVIRVEESGGYDGTYTVMDTGPKVRGHHVDVFVDDCAAAKRFGRRNVRVTIVDTHE